MAFRFVASSDWHLGGMQRVLTNPLEYQMREINKVYQYALSNSIEHVIVPGDLAHTPNLNEDELLAVITLLLTHDESIHTRYILGNHDVESIKKNSLSVLSAIAEAGFFRTFKVHKQPTVEKFEGVYFSFLPFPHLEPKTTPKPPIVVAHIETAGAVGDNGRPLKTGHEDRIVRQTGDFILTGHLHQYQYLKKKRILYVGSLYQTTFGETLPKGFLDIVAKYKNGKLLVDHRQINSKPDFVLETKVISLPDQWEELDETKSVRYRIIVDEGLVVPSKIQDKLKNIISITGISKKVNIDLAGETTGAVTSASSLPQFKITTGLKKYVQQSGLDERQMRRAQGLAKEAAQHLGLT